MGYFLLKATTITTLLILLLQAFLLCSAAGQDDDYSNIVYLRDENGELMLNGGTYYLIRRINRKDAGGLTLVPNITQGQGSSCPLYITQEKDANSNGIPVKISSHISTKYLPYGTTEFTFVGVNTECNEPLVWRVRSDSATGHDYVEVGTPDWSTLPNAFFILTPFNYVEPNQYEINFCDHGSVCGRANFQGENGHLAINNELDVVFRFRKVSNNNESPMLINSVI